MKHKLLLMLASTVASLATLFALTGGHAFAATVTWTGTAGDNKFSTGGNWQGGVAPVNGDTIVLPFAAAPTSYNTQITNDIDNLSLAGITLTGNTGAQGCSTFGYYNIVNGGSSSTDPLTLTGNIDASGVTGSCILQLQLRSNVDLGADSVITQSSASYISFGVYNGYSYNLTIGSHNISASNGFTIYSNITGSGAITASGILALYGDNSIWTGTPVISNGEIWISQASSLGFGSNAVSLPDNTGLGYDSGSASTLTLTRQFDVSGGPYSSGSGSKFNFASQGCSSQNSVILNGQVNLGGNVDVYANCAVNIQFTNVVKNNFDISNGMGSFAVVTVNGQPAKYNELITNVTDSQPNLDVYVVPGEKLVISSTGQRGKVDVPTGGFLMGTGKVGAVTVHQGGHIAPGNSPGCLSTGNITINGTYDAELGGTTPCSGYDQLKVTGTVDVTGATLNATLYNNFKPAKGNSFTIIDNDGSDAVTGTFNNLPEGATFNIGSYVFKITYKGGDGNDVVITAMSVPATPNTGYQLLLSHPIQTFIVTTGLAVGIYALANKDKLAILRRR